MKKVFAILTAAVIALSLCGAVSAAGTEEEAFATVDALQFDVLPDIDGKVSVEEWGQPTVAHIKYPENPQTDICKDDQTDVEFTIWFRYTFDGFYVAAQVPDTSPCNKYVHDHNIWNGDALQMRFDPYGCTEDQGLTPASAREANYSADYQELVFAYNTEDGLCYTYCWHGIMVGLALQSEGGSYAASNDGALTTYEIFIPWNELVTVLPHVGTTYGISAAILTATDGENNNEWQNWLEWGAGVINGRDDNICGTSRMVMSGETVFGGAPLVDPAPDATETVKTSIPEAEGDAVIIDFSKLSGQNALRFENNDDGSVKFTFEDNNDPYVTLNISGQVKINGEDYPYFAIYLQTNDTDSNGELFYCTTGSVSDFTPYYSVPLEYSYVDGRQVVVADMTDALEYEGIVVKFRFDPYDGYCADPDESQITVYSAGFFKNYEDAVMFRANGVSVELDPEYVKEVSNDPAGTTTEAAATQAESTTEPADDTTAATGDVTDDAGTTAADTKDGGEQSKGNKALPFIIAGAVAAAAAIAAVIAVIAVKKKKK
ncbi:MAG: hypothetical protein J5585_11230 [Clostridia bacterium]|nr:hypothetical protein [Clostridia bacterium]